MYMHQSASILFRLHGDHSVEYAVRPDIACALSEALRRAPIVGLHARLGDLFAQDLVGLLSALADRDARAPTAAQIKFGLDIARRLGVDLPVGALQDRAVMGRFLSRYADSLRSSSLLTSGEGRLATQGEGCNQSRPKARRRQCDALGGRLSAARRTKSNLSKVARNRTSAATAESSARCVDTPDNTHVQTTADQKPGERSE
jgi:hypothetical protein